MTILHDKIETAFANLGHWVYRRRYLTLVFVLGLTVALVSQLSQLTVDTSNDAFYHPDDSIRVEYNEFRQQFGKDDHIFIGINPNQIFDAAFLKKLEQLHLEIEQKVPHLNKVTSLLNVRNTYGQGDELIIEDLIESIPTSAEQMKALQETARGNAFYQDYLISADGQFTFIDIEPVAVTTSKHSHPDSEVEIKYVSTKEYAEIIDALQPILEKYHTSEFEIYAAGFPVITDRLTRAIEQTMAELTPLTLLLNLIFLTLLFRRVSGVIYPTLIVMLTIISTIGVMAWFSIALDLVTTVLPTLLTVVAIADSVHLLSGFYKEYEKNGGDKKAAITYSMGRNGLPILMTSVTTSLGLASFILADLAPVSHLGFAAPIGIILAFIYTILLLPALIAIFPIRKPGNNPHMAGTADRLLDWVAEVSCQRYKSILISSLMLLIVGVVGAFQLNISHNALTWLPDASKVRSDTSKIDDALGGAVPVEVIIDTGQKQGIYDPDLMRRLEQSSEEIKSLGSKAVGIGKINSLPTILKEVNRALHANNEDYYEVPDSRELIAQELLLFEISAADDLYRMVDDDYSKVRFTVMLPFTDAIQIKPVLDKIRAHFLLKYPDMNVSMTGIAPMLVQTMYDVITSMFKSYGFALIAITFMMIVLIGKLQIGLISMVPNLMGWSAPLPNRLQMSHDVST